MQDLNMFLSLATTVIGFAISTATFIVKYFRSEKAKKVAEDVIKAREILLPLIQEAEELTSLSGVQKKEYVLKKLKELTEEKDISYCEVQIDKKLEEIIALTKRVNVRKK